MTTSLTFYAGTSKLPVSIEKSGSDVIFTESQQAEIRPRSAAYEAAGGYPADVFPSFTRML